ncbi:precorrin-8X methylmutase [Clostridium botulinum]|uniref:Precorrin-8X methylmutase n=3 Tax=Clostridium botulinum TaxID=1491 RepID=A0A846I112_CLOBO|nr:precorrin-8X methylmutase [Clostridium botulinum]AJD28293.1 precorrin-8X methylmutase family protein [Clostridium botulinum CDC_297]ACQ51476.1 precorrin-8X methylmutase [Clostridium botulinum Ba4 str. 657]AJE09549.1 precorrin-8X methylmutase family protein [Clostridium botulinum CDC_1436]APU59814.1 precorrin-8X methylmutase family protein [Clostridium botulinum]AUN02533.1 precorrin-8X methylmutase [Clostridium botulinum]
MKDYIKKPMDIEKRSFEIIEEEMGKHNFSKEELKIVKRVIHTTADLEYKNLIYIKEGAIEAAKEILKKGTKIYTDTNMALSGINKKALKDLNSTVQCFVSREDVASIAKDRGITRSMAAVEMAAEEGIEFFVFGNAPTALYKLMELMKEGKAKPKFIIGVPVGFVGAAESKKELEKLDIPFITIRGRKGGSNVAASIVNALMYMLVKR